MIFSKVAPGATSKPKADGSAHWGFFGITEIPDHDNPEQVYLKRWRIIESPWFGVKVHHILLSDNPVTRGLHDHPWSFLSIRLRGNYTELRQGPNFENQLSRGLRGSDVCLDAGIYRRHTHRFLNVVRSTDLHAVRLRNGYPCWTLVLNGRRCREWGFRFPGGEWMPWHQLDGAHARNVRGRAGSTKETTP